MKAKFGGKELLEAARRENKNMTADEAPALHGDEGVVVVDLCDIRELAREVLMPGRSARRAACASSGSSRTARVTSPYHKDIFAAPNRFVCYFVFSRRPALAAQTV